jgi:diguanylate cyclase (GGDEF)-like protein
MITIKWLSAFVRRQQIMKRLRQKNIILRNSLSAEEQLRKELAQELKEAQAQMVTDYATGLKNRQGLAEHYTRMADTAFRTLGYNLSSSTTRGPRDTSIPATDLTFWSIPMTLVIIDLNNFKRVNDTTDHLVGDSVLLAFADVLRQTFRRRKHHDYPARVGGDEFAVLLPYTSTVVAEELMKQFLRNFENSPSPAIQMFRGMGGGFSYGIANVAYFTQGNPLEDAWRVADKRMYAMKKAKKVAR